MRAMKRLRQPSRIAFIAPFLAASFLQGCGEPEVGDPQIVTAEVQPTATPLPIPTATPEPVEFDFASVTLFPDLTYATSRSLSTEDTLRNIILDLPEYSSDLVWRSVAPATFELTLPTGATVYRIEVEGAEGVAGFPECVVFVRSATETDWRRPSGLVLEQQLGRFIEGKGYRLRHVFSFDETSAEKALIGIAKGSNESPESVAVVDLDVFGYLRE
jgi:hypothetical protein